MATAVGLDELLRAAEAAGFAMAAPDEEPTLAATTVQAVSVEDIARGARDVKSTQTAPAQPSGFARNGGRSGAYSVRETVYGYLGFGVPA
jgi:hypothetical protein